MPVVIAAICAAVYGVADYCGGRASRSAPSTLVTLLGQLASLTFGILVVAIARDRFAGATDLLWGAGAGVASAVALVAFYHALSQGAMTVVAPITAVTSAVLPIVFALSRGERPKVLAYVGIAIAVIAVVLVSGALGERRMPTSRHILLLSFVAGTGFAGIFIALAQASAGGGYWPLLSSRTVSICLMAAVVFGRRNAPRVALLGMPRSILLLAATSGILDMAANVLYLLAVRRGLLSIVVVVVALYPVSTVCLAYRLDHERVSRSQAVGMGLAACALVLVSVAGAN